MFVRQRVSSRELTAAEAVPVPIAILLHVTEVLLIVTYKFYGKHFSIWEILYKIKCKKNEIFAFLTLSRLNFF
jgi:hypothetical protein